MKVKSIQVKSMSDAWQKVDEIFPTDYELNNMLSERAGYNVYSSTAEGHYYDYICDLGNRLEINLSSGDTINVWASDDTDVKSTETMKGEDTMKSTETKSTETMSTETMRGEDTMKSTETMSTETMSTETMKGEDTMKSTETMSKREMKNVSINAYKEFLAYLEENSSTIPMNVFFRYCSLNGFNNPFAVRKALTIRLAHYGKAGRDTEEKAVKVLSVSIFRKAIEGHEIDAVMNADVIGKNYKERAQHERAQRGVISAKLTDREIATIRAALEGMSEDVINKALDKALVKKLEDKKARDAAQKANA